MERSIYMLGGAIFCEVLWAVMLKVGQGLALSWATALTAVAYVLSLVFLSAACKQLDLSLAYAVWTGSGAAIVALIGVFMFGESINWARCAGILLVIVGVIVLLGFEPRTT